MSISGSMYTGVSGLTSHAEAMSVISDNISNVNTVGFKSSRANFSDILGGMIGHDRIGNGSAITSVQTLHTQGSLLGTGNLTDLAIQGDGFFMVSPPSTSGSTSPLYTRAGQFDLDRDGYVVTQSGLRVQGYNVDAAGQLSGALGELQIPVSALPPSATAAVSMQANLDPGAPVATAAFDVANPDSTSQFQTAVSVYDSLGQVHQLELYFTHTADAPAQWEVNVTAASSELQAPGAEARTVVGTGTVEFNTDGSLAANSLTTVNVAFTGAATSTVALDFGTSTGSGGDGLDGLTGYAADSAVSMITQDGNSSGDLGGISIGEDGSVTGLYTNGDSRVVGQIATARFTAPQGLERLGDGLYAETADAGEPTVGAPGTGGLGIVVSGTLEASNVDLAAEFVNMIAVQRGFQSNSRSITTADEMLNEVVNLKR